MVDGPPRKISALSCTQDRGVLVKEILDSLAAPGTSPQPSYLALTLRTKDGSWSSLPCEVKRGAVVVRIARILYDGVSPSPVVPVHHLGVPLLVGAHVGEAPRLPVVAVPVRRLPVGQVVVPGRPCCELAALILGKVH